MKPYKCPVCDGTGLVCRPPGVPGDQDWMGYGIATYPCKACKGEGIVWETETCYSKAKIMVGECYVPIKEKIDE